MRVAGRDGLGRRTRLDSGPLRVLGVQVDNVARAADLPRGPHSRGLTTLTADQVVVDADAPGIAVGVDGDALLLTTPVVCRIAPGSLRVRVPRRPVGSAPGESADGLAGPAPTGPRTPCRPRRADRGHPSAGTG